MKELNEDGLEVVDGKTVRLYEIRFTGSILLEPEDAASIGSGDRLTCFVTGYVQPPKFAAEKKTGAMKRQNVVKVQALLPVDEHQVNFVLDNLNLKVEGVNDGIIESPVTELNEEEKELGFDPTVLEF